MKQDMLEFYGGIPSMPTLLGEIIFWLDKTVKYVK